MSRYRGTKPLPEAQIEVGKGDGPGDVLVMTKRNKRRVQRELRRRARHQTTADVTALAAADSKRDARRARNLAMEGR